MRILAGRYFFEQFGQKAMEICQDCKWVLLEPDGSLSDSPEGTEVAVLISDAYCQKFKELILNISGMKWVHTENTGVDDPFYREVLARNILLTRSSGANAPEVAEFVFSMILWKIKNLNTFYSQQQVGLWQRKQLQSLSDKTILVLGLGAIGSRVVKIAKSFDMHVLGIRKSHRHIPGVDKLGTLADLQTFLPQADIVVLALPLSSQTEGLIDNRELNLMKETALFINVARGKMVNTESLKKHLYQKPEMQACLDVLSSEPWPSDDELWNYPNVFITPHIAWSSPLYRPRAANIWLDNLKRFQGGLKLNHVVT